MAKVEDTRLIMESRKCLLSFASPGNVTESSKFECTLSGTVCDISLLNLRVYCFVIMLTVFCFLLLHMVYNSTILHII